MTKTFQKVTGCDGGQRHPRRWPFLSLALAVWTLAAALAPAPAPAQDAAPYARALDLAGGGRLRRALDTLRAWQPRDAAAQEQKLWGEAVILRQMGREAEALPRLEALVARRPDVPRFRIALGETLATLGQGERARLQFEEALGTASDADRARASKGLGALEVAEVLSGHFALSFIPATNAAQRTSARTIVLGGRPFTINPSARKTSALGVRAQAGVTFAPKLSDTLRLRFGLSGDAKIYDGNAEDDITLRGEGAVVLTLSPDSQVEVGLTYSRRWIDGAGYSEGPGLTFGLVTYTGKRSRLQFAAVVDDLTHDRAPALDGVRSLAVLAYGHAVSPQLHLRGSLRAERANARTPSNSFTAWEVGLGATYAFRGGLRVGLDIGWRTAEFDAMSLFYGTLRADEQLSAALRLSHARVQVMGFAPVVELDYTHRSSTIPIYSFDDVSAQVGLTRRF